MVRACVSQAEEFFWLAEDAGPNTAPLLYYYSMLNLAKALIYVDAPDSLRSPSSLLHGLSDPSRVKDADRYDWRAERLKVKPGIFSILAGLLPGHGITQGTELPIYEALRYCTWVGSEMSEVQGDPSRLVGCELQAIVDDAQNGLWVNVYVDKAAVKNLCGTQTAFMNGCAALTSTFTRVSSDIPERLRFESKKIPFTAGVIGQKRAFESAGHVVRSIGLYRHLIAPDSDESGGYLIPLDDSSIAVLPEPCVLLAVAF